jgi:hypothetical protein
MGRCTADFTENYKIENSRQNATCNTESHRDDTNVVSEATCSEHRVGDARFAKQSTLGRTRRTFREARNVQKPSEQGIN